VSSSRATLFQVCSSGAAKGACDATIAAEASREWALPSGALGYGGASYAPSFSTPGKVTEAAISASRVSASA
jgi:hypothetical protein